VKINKINSFWLILNNVCNNRCQFCYLKEAKLEGTSEMSLGYARDLAEKMKKAGASNCILIGGEPTLYKDLVKLIETLKHLEIDATLVTNGRRLSNVDYTKNIIHAGLDRVVVSVEGWDKESHNLITGARSFKETEVGIKNALNLGIKTETLTTISTLNCNNLEGIYRLLTSWGVKTIDFNFAIPQLNEKSQAEWTYTPNLAKAVENVEKLYLKVISEGRGQLGITGTVPLCLFNQKIVEELMDKGWVNFGCHMYWGTGIAFDGSGSILPCTHFAGYGIGEKNINVEGKSKVTDFVKFSNSGLAYKFRKKLFKYPTKKCVECKYWGYCVGGCPLLWLDKNPDDIIS